MHIVRISEPGRPIPTYWTNFINAMISEGRIVRDEGGLERILPEFNSRFIDDGSSFVITDVGFDTEEDFVAFKLRFI